MGEKERLSARICGGGMNISLGPVLFHLIWNQQILFLEKKILSETFCAA